MKLIFATLVFIAALSVSGLAQNPVPDPDTVQTPVQEGDPTIETLPRGLDYVEKKKKITPEELPDAVKQSLESSAQYTEWQKAAIYHEENKDEYLVEFFTQGRTTTYRFDKDGKPIIEEK
jgi:hypothetical protein